MKIKTLIIAVMLCIIVTLCGCQGNAQYEKDLKLYGTHTAVMTVENYGDVTIELYGDIAPVTVANFVNLVKRGFYNGLTFTVLLKAICFRAATQQATAQVTAQPKFTVNLKATDGKTPFHTHVVCFQWHVRKIKTVLLANFL
jgi:cyclophilin family peptidyl-prolyl cis-trans isomerase